VLLDAYIFKVGWTHIGWGRHDALGHPLAEGT
jgi:hypothetical protein